MDINGVNVSLNIYEEARPEYLTWKNFETALLHP
jgi:hypothetical protein